VPESGNLTREALRESWRSELFDRVIPFWEQRGFDPGHGGFYHRLTYDGSLLGGEKFLWFQGRGLWVWSFLYNHFGRDPARLEIARQTKDFLLAHGRQPDGWWSQTFTREGRVVEPFGGDLYGMYFVAEGLLEYAAATGDEQARQTAREILERLWRRIHEPEFGPRTQGLWMLSLRIATQILRRERDPLAQEMADEALDAITERHYHPEIGLNNEVLTFDFSRLPCEQAKCVFGHSIESLWMVLDEAERRGDDALWRRAAERIRRHLDVGWDHVFGGLAHAVNVDQPTYCWPEEKLPGTDFTYRAVGEYNYLKSLWAVNEVILATLMVYLRTGEEWAWRYLSLAEEVRREKFSLQRLGYPTYILFADRRITYRPPGDRQDNYHLPRQLMLGVLLLERVAGQRPVV
jgi:mannose/cellobiose epimerase-like protein (N-acyl-D-glucosamine 2-epimerase family)